MSDDLTEVFGTPEPVATAEPGELDATIEAESSTAEPVEAETVAGEPAAPEEEPAPRKKTAAEKRIDELTARRYDAERQLAEERGRAAAFERMLAERNNPAVAPVVVPNEADDAPPDPSLYDGTPGKSMLDLINHRADWAARQHYRNARAAEVRAAQEAQAVQQQQAEVARQNEVQAKGVSAYPDFLPAIEDLRRSGTVTPFIYGAALHDANAQDLFYFLAKKPEEARRINALPPMAQITEIAKLSQRIANHKGKKTSTNAGAPIKAAVTAQGSTVKDRTKMTPEQWEDNLKAQREAEWKKTGRKLR